MLTKLAFDEPPHRSFAPYTLGQDAGILMLNLGLLKLLHPVMSDQDLIARMRSLALQAGQEIMKLFATDDLAISQKPDASPVTRADHVANDIISSGLRQAFPDIPIISEEQSNFSKLDSDRFILIDPIDGTRSFINKEIDFTVNIALIESAQPMHGLIYAPAHNRLFYTTTSGTAVEEGGDFLRDASGPTYLLSGRKKAASELTVLASRSSNKNLTEQMLNKLNKSDCKFIGSSLKFCLIAAGEADLYPRLGTTMQWDTAAGHAILTAAGGQVVRYDDRRPLRYNPNPLHNPWFIALGANVAVPEV